MFLTRRRLCNVLFQQAEQSAQKSTTFNTQKVKPTTSLVGVPVQPRWRDMIIKLTSTIIKECETLPSTFYRQSTINNMNFIQKVCSENDDYETAEDLINRGQVEEVIFQLEDELKYLGQFKENKLWQIDENSLELERETYLNGEDPAFPSNYESPVDSFELKTWSGVYNVEYTNDEINELEREPKDYLDKEDYETYEQLIKKYETVALDNDNLENSYDEEVVLDLLRKIKKNKQKKMEEAQREAAEAQNKTAEPQKQ